MVRLPNYFTTDREIKIERSRVKKEDKWADRDVLINGMFCLEKRYIIIAALFNYKIQQPLSLLNLGTSLLNTENHTDISNCTSGS